MCVRDLLRRNVRKVKASVESEENQEYSGSIRLRINSLSEIRDRHSRDCRALPRVHVGINGINVNITL